jgi:ribonuclease P/MRP protein subunit RPP40
VIGKHKADWIDVTSDVPQDSVLGPLLFVIYIKDMPEVVSHLVKLFADDSKLIATIRSNNDLSIFQGDLNALMEWSNTWRMLFNVEKCKVMDFSRTNGKPIYSDFVMGDSQGSSTLKYLETEKDLGVTLSRNLKFSTHIRIQANEATAILGADVGTGAMLTASLY